MAVEFEGNAKIATGFLPEEDGREIERLIVYVEGKPVDSVIIGNPMTADCVIEKLALLSWRLMRHKHKRLEQLEREEGK